MTVTHERAGGGTRTPRRALVTLASAALLTGVGWVPLAQAEPAADHEATDAYNSIELQVRSNLLVNDEGWNLPPGSSWNSITPDINDEAEVALRVQYVAAEGSPSDGAPGIWMGSHGQGSVVYRAGATNQIDNDVSLNDGGDVAFTLADGGVNNVLYRYDADSGEASQVSTSPVLPNSYSTPGIDEDGNIGFQASFGAGRALAALRDGEGSFYVQDSGLDSSSPYGFLYTPRANDAGTIAVKVGLVEDISNEVQIRAFGADGSDTLLLSSSQVDPESPYSKFDNSLGLSDNGKVAVIATRADDGARVVVRIDGSTVTEVAAVGDDGLTELAYFSPDINDEGQVTFRGSDSDGQAVFVSDGQTLTKVAGDGTPVETDLGAGELGQHDTSPVFGGAPKINNHGDVSFSGGLHPAGDDQVEWGSGVFVAYADSDEEPPNARPVVEDIRVQVEEGEAVDFTMEASDPDGDDLSWSWTDPVKGELTGPGPDFTYQSERDGIFFSRVTVSDGRLSSTGQILITVTPAAQPPEVEHPETVERLRGANRYGTAAATALDSFGPGVGVVYVATGSDFPDALTSAALAGSQSGPVLLTRPEQLPEETAAALDELAPERIVVVGGQAAVSGDVATELEEYTDGSVDRIQGANRYATAANLAAEFDDVDTVYVATGRDFPDALAASAQAGAEDVPVLLVRPDELPDETATALNWLDPTHVVLLGGTSAVDNDVLADIEAVTGTDVERLFGKDRYETAVKLSQDADTSDRAFVATGRNWPDALSAAAVAASADVPVLLTRPTDLPPVTATELERLEPPVISVVGGTTAIEESVLQALAALDYTD